MINMKERSRPCLGTQMVRQNQRGRFKESSSLDRNNETILNYLLCFDFVFDILDYSSDATDSLVFPHR